MKEVLVRGVVQGLDDARERRGNEAMHRRVKAVTSTITTEPFRDLQVTLIL